MGAHGQGGRVEGRSRFEISLCWRYEGLSVWEAFFLFLWREMRVGHGLTRLTSLRDENRRISPCPARIFCAQNSDRNSPRSQRIARVWDSMRRFSSRSDVSRVEPQTHAIRSSQNTRPMPRQTPPQSAAAPTSVRNVHSKPTSPNACRAPQSAPHPSPKSHAHPPP